MEESRKYYILFDLDGTLTDPKEGICTCFQYALKAFGIDEPDLDKLEPVIGPPLRDSFVQFYGFSADQAEEAVKKYRERYATDGVYENEVYAGIHSLLRSLRDAGMHLGVATSKPQNFAETILKHYKLDKYFEVVVGGDLEGHRDTKELVVAEALRQLFKEKPIRFDQVFMVGDRKFDVEGAHKMGIQSVGVTYGYGSMEELREAHSDYIVRTVGELQKFLLRGTDEEEWVSGMLATRDGEAGNPGKNVGNKGLSARGNLGNGSGGGKADGAGARNGQNGPGKGIVREPLRLKNLWALLYAFLIFVIIRGVAIQALQLGLFLLAGNNQGRALDGLLVRDAEGLIAGTIPNVTAVFTLIGYLCGTIPILRIAKLTMGRMQDERKLTHLKKDTTLQFALMAVTTFALVLGLNLFTILTGVDGMSESYLQTSASQYSCHFLLGLLLYGLVTPICEEVLFRGIIYNYLRRFYVKKIALLLAAFLFGFYHGNSIQGMYAFIMGALMCYAYEYFASFWAPVLIHVGANLIAYVLTYAVSDNSILFRWPVCIVALVVGVAALYCLMNQKKGLMS